MEWSATLPTVPGYYWITCLSGGYPEVVRVLKTADARLKVFFHDDLPIYLMDHAMQMKGVKWMGPLDYPCED